MKLRAQTSEQAHDLNIALSDRRVVAEVDGRPYDLEIHQLDERGYLLFDKSHVYECRVNSSRASRGTLNVILRGHNYEIAIVDPKRLRSAQSSSRHTAGAAEIIASMPGKVVRVLVEVGTQVEAGTGIVVVEAMKMQNEMKAPRAGVVVSIGVDSGATVNAGDVLAVVE
jgi:biotin carboxyl carrier protein